MLYTLKKWLFRLAVKVWSGPWFPNVYTMIHSVYLPRALYVAGELRIADVLQQRPRTIDELAELTKTHKRSLYRIMRLLCSYNVFREDRQGQFHLDYHGKTMVSTHPESSLWWVLSLGNELWESNSHILESVRTGETGFKIAHGTPVWQWYPRHPVEHDIFIKGMNGFSRYHCGELVQAFPFAKFKTLVDVGGGGGLLMCEILKRVPHATGIVFDQPRTIEETSVRIREQNLSDRCQAVGGNFFEGLPPNADAYIIKHVLRDWDDESVVNILRSCREAMGAGGTLLIVDALVDPRNGEDRLLKLIDVQMMVDAGGGLRTLEEFEQLLSRAGFEIVRTHSTTIIDGSIIEAKPIKDFQEKTAVSPDNSTLGLEYTSA